MGPAIPQGRSRYVPSIVQGVRICVCVHYSALISGLNCRFTSGVDVRDCKTDQNSITHGTEPVIYGAS